MTGAAPLPLRPAAPAATLVASHRGAWRAGHPQNSLEAFEAAIAIGAEMIEFDVRRAACGSLLISHDPAAGGLDIAASTRADLGAAGAALPTLDEVVELAAGRIGLDVEIKEAGYERATLAGLAPALVAEPPLIVTSFRDSVVATVRAAAPGVPAGLLYDTGTVSPGGAAGLEARLSACRATAALPWEPLLADPRPGLPLVPWPLNEEEILAAAFADPDVPAIITDEPGRALAVRAGLG